jgi:hypothetical protein
MRFFLWLIPFGLLASSARVIDFDHAPIGKAPAGWIFVGGKGHPQWEIRRDQTAPTQPYVLAEVSGEPANGRFPLAIFDALYLRDADVSVRIKPLAGKEGSSAGIVWRYRDENNYYVARANPAENKVVVYRVVKGQRMRLGESIRHDIAPNTWCILKVSARANRFQIYVDHRRILQGQDNTFTGSGKVGLWTASDTMTYFDDFRVYPK